MHNKQSIQRFNEDIKRNYFNYKQMGDKYLLTNDLGKFVFINEEEFNSFVNNEESITGELQLKLKENYFIYENRELFVEDAAVELRKYKSYLMVGTQLHIFVLTTYCNLRCIYCQASASGSHNNAGTSKIMSSDVAEKAVDLALKSASDDLMFEFQGGEPLANFNTLKHIVEYTNEKNKGLHKRITYNLVSNLTLITQDMIKFLVDNNVVICTSIDGPEIIHNNNRLYSQGNCLETIKKNIIKINEYKDNNSNCVQAIQTTTKHSLKYGKEIVDEYISLGLNSIFIRPLTPIGFAAKNWDEVGYTPEEFLIFYEQCLDYIIELASNGINISEGHAVIFLKKILRNSPINYMELRSPCGGVIGQLAYNYDGNIYTCDEGRMLAETGDLSFKLGDVFHNTLSQVLASPVCKTLCTASCLEAIPGCEQCAYSPYCGVCPVCNHAQYKKLFTGTPNSYKCKIYKGILDILFLKINENDSVKNEVFKRWIE
ncbi:His-Xaa-Ser system radical SAM maturase HxsB [Clostridium estertheticum]|uniref:His-Xaa-Ser system radical SAM maturase HxsB n=1 Tax=Clostridium estertheticum TaxID=238834 RepID=UPI001C7D35FD|nr:His-Xaa-Ser system radical SAM maturase HxsB [Clostridium estertheticum]MBX4271121.1 His-Xaa-Ser system radical SAM maturase HxsB [Clostridium estertheticum]WLC78355.1 His-Xaa-Ser system radical SAM maturase HxsB [Clostridium estertheticum]